MANQVYRDASSAWRALCATGGIELEGRDVELKDKLRLELSSSAPTLEQALLEATTDQLVRALFDVAQPFVQMFRAILEFFKAASAKEGRADWTIKIEEEHLDLEHFQSFLKTWDEIKCEFEVPAIDMTGAFVLQKLTHNVEEFKDRVRGVGESPWRIGVSDVDLWLEAYSRGQYSALPASLQPARLGPGYRETAKLVAASIAIIKERWSDWYAMDGEYRARRFGFDAQDALSYRTIAQDETDLCIPRVIARLAIAQQLPEQRKTVLGEQLEAAYAKYPRRKVRALTSIAELEKILSLPVWQRRHELYAVWIATEIVNACPGHTIELHHEDGRIVFAFKETVVATITSTSPIVRLVAEKRSPLKNPVGHGRKDNVQPDYGLWSGDPSVWECKLVVEVKHYKRAAPTKFAEVLQDYARAHTKARILLVNYGPVGVSIVDLPRDVFLRCETIDNLTPYGRDARSKFGKEVCEILGKPLQPFDPSASGTVIALDISPSMAGLLKSPQLTKHLDRIGRGGRVALVDSAVQKVCSVDSVLSELPKTQGSGATDLVGPIKSLLETYTQILVLTDEDGYRSLTRGLTTPLRAEHLPPGFWSIEINSDSAGQ